jgi:hypothetical protein
MSWFRLVGSSKIPSGVSPHKNNSVLSSPGSWAKMLVNLELSIYFTFTDFSNLANCSNLSKQFLLFTSKGSWPVTIS